MISLEEIILKIKQNENIKSQKDAAAILGLNSDALIQRLKRDSIPHQKVHEYCYSKDISLDTFYNSNTRIASVLNNNPSEESIYKKINIYNSDESIRIPLGKVDTEKLVAYFAESTNTLFVANTNHDKFIEDGEYLLDFNGQVSIKEVTATFQNTFIFNSVSTSSKISDELKKNELKNIKFVGKVVKKLTYI